MKAISLLSALALTATLVAVQDPNAKSDLTRKFKEGETHRYKLALKMDRGSVNELTGNLEMKIVKTPAGKPAEGEIKMIGFKQTVDGAEGATLESPGSTKVLYDKFGMPDIFEVQNHQVGITVLAICSYLPAKSVAVNEEFSIDWKSPDGAGTVKGKGHIVSIKGEGDKKIAVVKSNLDVQPAQEQSPAKIEVESEFDLATGALLKSTGKGEIGPGSVTFSVSEVKETK